MFTKFLIDTMDKKLQQHQTHTHSHSHQQQQQQPHQQHHHHHSHSHSHPFHGNPKQIPHPLQAKLVALESNLKCCNPTATAAATAAAATGNNNNNSRNMARSNAGGGGRQGVAKESRDREAKAAGISNSNNNNNNSKYDTNLGNFNRYCVPQVAAAAAAAAAAAVATPGGPPPLPQTVTPLLSQVHRNHDLTDKLTRMARRSTLKFRELASMQVQDKNTEALQELQASIPEISKIFDIHCRIGSGTFSTVLLGTLQRERQLPEAQRRRFAIKHHNPTNHPERILRELECMFRMGGQHNVIGINCCIRYNDNVAFVMPFMSHDRFHDVYRNLSLAEVKDYLRNLLVALRHVHKFNVIHRDVKPSNILYNRRTAKFLLCDFGLAQRLAEDGSLIQASDLSGAAALLRDIDAAQQQLLQHDGNSLQAEVDAAAALRQQQEPERRVRAAGGGTTAFGEQQQQGQHWMLSSEPTKKELAAQKADTQRLINRLRFVNTNVDPNNYVVSTNSTRKEMHASRAGTPGYRPPEVLLRYPYQTTAVDVWAAGVIMLSMLSSLHPFFKAPNDCAALSEIMNLFGDLQVRKTAFMLDRLVLITQKVNALDLRRICMRFRYANYFLSPDIQRRHRRADGTCELCHHCEQTAYNCVCKHSSHKLENYEDIDMFPHQAYDLLSRLLEVNPQKRISAEEALKHPFFGEHHRLASGIPLSQLPQQPQQGAHLRARGSLHSVGSRTLMPYVTYPSGMPGAAAAAAAAEAARASAAASTTGTGAGAGTVAGAGAGAAGMVAAAGGAAGGAGGGAAAAAGAAGGGATNV